MVVQLHQNLAKVLTAHPLPTDVKSTIFEFRRIAAVYLRHKVFVGSLRTDQIGLSIEDIAMDCIAPLFARDGSGQFYHLKTYFERLSWERLAQEELLSATRRLLFSSVNQGLSKIWGQLDPSLAKLLRNLKAAIHASSRLQLVEHAGMSSVVLKRKSGGTDLLEEMSLDYLEGMLSTHMHHRPSMRVVVDAVADILKDQECYRSEVSLVTLALAVREASARASLPMEEIPAQEADRLSRDEVSGVIRASVRYVSKLMEGTYLLHGKTDQALYDAYFNAIEALLHARYADRDGEGLSLYHCLIELRTTMTVTEYRRFHRARLEYLFKISEREFLTSAKKML